MLKSDSSSVNETLQQLKAINYDFTYPVNIRILHKITKKPIYKRSFYLLKEKDLRAFSNLIDKCSSTPVGHVYYCPNVSTGFKNADVKYCQVLFAEYDDIPKAEQIEKFNLFNIPTCLIETYKSIHAYWTLSSSISADKFSRYQSHLAALLGSDKTLVNPSRLMRLAGVLYPSQPPVRVKLLNVNDQKYAI